MNPTNNNLYGSASIPLNKVTCSTSMPWMIKLISKIYSLVKKIFSIIFFWMKRKKKEAFIPKVEIINDIKTSKLNKVKNKHIINKDIIISSSIPQELTLDTTCNESISLSLKAFKNILVSISHNLIDFSINKLEDNLPKFKEIKYLDKIYLLAKPIVKEKIIDSKSRILSNLKKILFYEKTAKRKKRLKKSLNWVLKDNEASFSKLYSESNKNNFHLKFIAAPEENFNELKNLMNKNDFFYHLDNSLNFLLTEKSNNFLNFFHLQIFEKIPHLILDYIKRNSKNLSEILIDKIILHLEKIDFKIVLGQIIQIFTAHINNIISAEKKFNNIHSDKKQSEETFLTIYTSEKETHSNIKNLFLYKNIPSEKNSLNLKEKKVIKKFIKEIENIFISNEKEKNLIEFILNKFEFTEEINEIFINIKEFIEHSISYKLNSEDHLSELILLKTKKIISDLLRKEINKLLISHLHTLYKKLISPQEIIKFFGNSLFPALNQKLLQKHISNIILHKMKLLQPYFNQLRLNMNDIENIKQLKLKIFELVKNECHLYNFNTYKIDFSTFCAFYLNDIFELIIDSFNNDAFKNNSLEEILKSLFFTPHIETDDRMSELFLSLVFEAGEFGGTFSKKIAACGKNKLNEILGSSIYPFILHKHQVIDLIVNALDRNIGNKELLKNFFFNKQKVVDEEDTISSRKLLSFEITKVASILHDMGLEGASNSTNWVSSNLKKKIITSYIGNDSSKIENTFITIFNKIFNKEYTNANLVFKIQDLFINLFKKK